MTGWLSSPFALYCKIFDPGATICYNALLHNTPGYKQTYAFPNPHESTHSVSIPTDFHLYRSKYNSKNYIHNIHSLNNDLSTQMYVLLPSNQNYPNRIRFPNRYIPIRDAVFLWKEVFHVLPIESHTTNTIT